MIIERITSWDLVRRFLLERVESVGSGFRAEHVPVMEAVVQHPWNWVVRVVHEGVEGLLFFVRRGDGIYEVHALTARSQWGWRWLRLTRAVLRWFLERNSNGGAVQLTTYIPAGKRCGLMYARRVGFRSMGKDNGGREHFELRREA